MKPLNGFFVLLTLSFPLASLADADFCVEMLRRAVYNQYYYSYDASTYSEAQTSYCRKYNEAKSQSSGLNLKIVTEDFDLGGNWNDETKKNFSEMFCQDTLNIDSSELNIKSIAKTISETVAGPLQTCAEAAGAGIKATAKFPNDNTMTLSLFYAAAVAGAAEFQTITHPAIIPTSMTCKGDLKDAKVGAKITAKVMAMTCTRNQTNRTSVGGRRVIHPGGTVTVFTSALQVIGDLPKRLAPFAVKTCGEEKCPGRVIACFPSRENPTETSPVWYSTPLAPDFSTVPHKIGIVEYGRWDNAQCNLFDREGWYARIGSCGTGKGSMRQACAAVKVLVEERVSRPARHNKPKP